MAEQKGNGECQRQPTRTRSMCLTGVVAAGGPHWSHGAATMVSHPVLSSTAYQLAAHACTRVLLVLLFSGTSHLHSFPLLLSVYTYEHRHNTHPTHPTHSYHPITHTHTHTHTNANAL